MSYKTKRVIGIKVYIDNRKSRSLVGVLSKKDNLFKFEYDDKYLEAKNSISMGPELPLTQKEFRSKKLFQSFKDRIPSKENPAYPEYCKKFGISIDEKEPFMLLSTIARKGPSSFIFEAVFQEEGFYKELRAFRKELGLSLRDFASLFDVSLLTLQRLETGKAQGKEVMKRLQIYLKFPEVALFEVDKNSHKVNERVKKKVISIISKK